jgi:hypothetical protein
MHIGQKKSFCPCLKIDNWDVKLVEDFETGRKITQDELIGDHIIEESESEKYLGDYITNTGRNDKNIDARRSKGIGIVRQIMTKLESVVFGPFYFEVALILRGSNLLNGILTNSEAWYGLTKQEVEQLEHIDEMLLRKILEVGVSCPKEMLYLETGATPIRFVIMTRRLMFLHYILNQEKESLIFKCFEAQMRTPCRNDWVISVQKDFEELEIMVDLDDIKTQSQHQFNTFLKRTVEEETLNYLNKLKSTHTKVLHIRHNRLELQKYLQPEFVQSIQLSKFTFQARTRMLDLRMNYKQMYKKEDLRCPLKCIQLDSQQHLLVCPKIENNRVTTPDSPVYDDLFSEEVKKIIRAAIILEENFRKRKILSKS